MSSQKIHIKVPIGLASAIANHRGYTRVMATFCRLKALESSSRYTSWRKQLERMAEFCHVSTRTIETRIAELKLAGLVVIDGKDLVLVSWDKVWTKFNITFKTKKYWHYDNEKIPCKAEYLFQLLAIREVQRNMRFAYSLRLKDRPDYQYELKSILGVNNRPINAQDHLAGVLKAFVYGGYTDQEVYMLSYLNPDDQVSTAYLQKFFGYAKASPSGPSYRKQKLAKLGLATIEKRSFQSEIRARSANSGTTAYSRMTKKTFLRLCDRISPAI
jgi:hypothetical protein